jgi:hypothetical protein
VHLQQVVPQDLERLTHVRLGVLARLLLRQHLARLRTSRRIPHLPGEVPDDQHRDVPEVLELPQLPQHDGMPERQIRPRRIHSELDPQRPSLHPGQRDPPRQLPLGKHLRGPALQLPSLIEVARLDDDLSTHTQPDPPAQSRFRPKA